MASLAATHAGRLGVKELVLANRTRERAERLASHAEEAGVATRVVDFSERAAALPTSTWPSPPPAPRTSPSRPPTFLPAAISCSSISLPRDIDDAAAAAEGVDLVNIERLSKSLSAASTDPRPAPARTRRPATSSTKNSRPIPRPSACATSPRP